MFPHIQSVALRHKDLGLVSVSSVDCSSGVGSIGGQTIAPSTAKQVTMSDGTNYFFDGSGTGVYYNLNRQYIGTLPVVNMLKFLDMIDVQCIEGDYVCSVGYSRKQQDWAHWSMFGLTFHKTIEEACAFGRMVKGKEFMCNSAKPDFDNLFAQNILTSPAFVDLLGRCGRIEKPINVEPEPEILPLEDQAEKFRERDTSLDSIFGDMFGNLFGQGDISDNMDLISDDTDEDDALVALFKNAKPIVSAPPVRSIGGPYHSDHGKISGEHRQHNVESQKTVFNNRRQSGDHIQHGVPTDSRPQDPYKANMNRTKISGEHIQHGHPNPPNLQAVSSSDLKSLSADSPQQYFWVRYSPANGRSKHFKTHHAVHEMSVDANDIFGWRALRTGDIHVVFPDHLKFKFKLTQKELDGLLAQSKPYRGKVMGEVIAPKAVPAPKTATVKQLTPKEKREEAQRKAIEEAATKKLEPKIKTSVMNAEGKIDLGRLHQTEALHRDTTYVGFFQTSVFVQDYNVYIDDDKEDLEDELRDQMRRSKQGVPVAYLLKVKTTLDWVKRLFSVNHPKLHKNIVERLLATHKHDTIETGINTEQFKEKPDQPKANKFKRSEPIYYGNSLAVLNEIKSAIIEGYFTKGFQIAQITGKSNINIDNKAAAADPMFGLTAVGDDDYMLVLAAKNSNPWYQQEADDIQGRLERTYGPALKCTTKVANTSSGQGITFVTIRLALAKRSDADLARSRKLHQLVKNSLDNKQGTAKRSSEKSYADSEIVLLRDKMKKIETDLIHDIRAQAEKYTTVKSGLEKELTKNNALALQKTSAVAGPRAAKEVMRIQAALRDIELNNEIVVQNLQKKADKEVEDLQVKINKLSEQLSVQYSKELALHVPVYAIKSSNGIFISVEVVDYSIPDGTIGVRTVRGNDRSVSQVKELYSYNGKVRVFP